MLEYHKIIPFLLVTASLAGNPSLLQAVTTSQQTIAQPTTDSSATTSPSIDTVLTKMILRHMPLQYEDDRTWGKQEERWDGIKIRREGIKLETKRRWKMVNHGTWRKYEAQLVDPSQQFSVELSNLRNTPDGAMAFDLNVRANLNLQARQSKWVKGVQLYSLSAEGNCQIQIALSCQTRILLGMQNLPPDVIFQPRVTEAQLSVDEFRLDRVSKVGGEVAQQVTQWARSAIENKIEQQQEKLVAKLNSKLDKNRNSLKLSLADALQSKWIQQTTGHMPKPVQRALNDHHD